MRFSAFASLLLVAATPAAVLAQQGSDTTRDPIPATTESGGLMAADGRPLPGEATSDRPPQTFDWSHSRAIPPTTPWGQAVDTAATRSLLSWTTMPEYTTALVDHLIEVPGVVSPTTHFGSPIGRPGVVHRVNEIYGYFEALAASSARVNFELLGPTEEGNRLALVQVGSERNLARLEETKRQMQALSDPRATSADEAARIIADAPVIYTFYAGLHSTETGPPEMVMELAHRLAVSDDPIIRTIRDSVVVFIVPVAEPDGRNRVVDWHRRHNVDVFDEDDRTSPPYWGKYIFHDNNRDGIQLSARLTQELVGLFDEWRYPLGHDLHESVPYLYTSTGTGPYNNQLDPITISEWQWMANWEVTDLTARGLPGVWTHGFYDGWYPGYLLWVTNTRNASGRFYETFGNGIPNTIQRTLGESATSVEWYRPNTPRDTTMWSMRNNTNYMQTGVLSALSLTAQNRTRILEQYWNKANNSLRRGRTQAPYGWHIPVDQARTEDVEYMLNLLQRQGVELHRATAEQSFDSVTVREGDYLIRMDQPYRNFIQTLMEVQEFPEDAPRPYDDVAWTFPLMFNVEATEIADSAVQRMPMAPVEGEIAIPGSLAGRGDWFYIVPEASAHSLETRFALRDVPVWVARDSVTAGGEAFPPGGWLIASEAIDRDRLAGIAAEQGLRVIGFSGSVERHELDLPRIAVLHSWRNTQDEGWTRFALDQFGVPYTYLAEDRLAEGGLRDRFDVILFPSQGARSTSKAIFEGVTTRFGPLAYTQTPEFPSHGFPDASEDITGGMGFEGLAALQDFIEGGGTLITLGSASTLPVDFGLVREVSLSSPSNVFIPGSIIQGEIERPLNPITFGYSETLPLYHRFGPYFSLPDRLENHSVVKYGAADGLRLSGLVEGGSALAEGPAVVTLPVGEGHVVLFGFDPLHRWQSFGNFALVWNAIMNWNDLDVGLEEGTAGEEDSR